MKIYISRLNPIRFLRQMDGEPKLDYYRTEIEKTMYSTVIQRQRYMQKFAIDDYLRFQISTIGEDYLVNLVVRLLSQDGKQYMFDIPYNERTGDFNSSGVRVYEVNHHLTSTYQGTWLVQIEVQFRDFKTFEIYETHCYISEPINVQSRNCELAKFKYKGDRNRPEYMMFWEFDSAVFEYEFRAEIRHDVINSAKVNAFEDRVTALKYVDGIPNRVLEMQSYKGVAWWLCEIISNMLAINELIKYNDMRITLDGDVNIETVQEFELLRSINFKTRETEFPLSIWSEYPIVLEGEFELL